jgi:CheY-like chemotaxis protein/glycine cleavage system H lipoate-binding protein
MEKAINILIVDDEQIILDSVRKHLRKEDYRIHTVVSADEALSLFEKVNIDVVLTDLMMPQTDGLEFMKIVKARFPHIPVIVITGYATINSAQQATRLGAFDYIAKPFSRSELLNAIHRAVKFSKKAAVGEESVSKDSQPVSATEDRSSPVSQNIGDNSWMIMEESGLVLLGVEQSYLRTIGNIQKIFVPTKGEKIGRGSVFVQVFSSDMRSHDIISPFSGTVVDTNEKAVENPEELKQDNRGKTWLIRLKPSKFEEEIKPLGL